MCRMMGIANEDRIRANWLLAFEPMAVKGKIRRDMTEPGHHDGWGLVSYFRESFPEYIERQPHSVTQDLEHFHNGAKVVEESGNRVALLHFRKLSVGDPKISNTHPFLYKEWSFCHNGTIHDSDKIPLRVMKPAGTTDSERLFLYLMEHLDPRDQRKSIKKSISEIQKNFKYSSLTFLLTDGKTIYAYRDFDPQYEDYYTLYTTEVNAGRMISSEEIPEISPRWDALPKDTFLSFNCQKPKQLVK